VLSILLQLFYFPHEFLQDVFPFFRQLDQCFEIINILLEPGICLNILFQPASLLQDRLRFLLIVPKLRLGYSVFELENL